MKTVQAAAANVLLVSAGLASCATGGSWVNVSAEASSSPYFNLSRPGVYKVEGGLEIAGRVCRMARTTLLSPSGVRLEHIAASGDGIEIARASIAPINRHADQRCSDYATVVHWALADGESVRACIDRGHACLSNPPTQAVVAVPATPPAPRP